MNQSYRLITLAASSRPITYSAGTPTSFSKREIVGCEASVRTVLRSTWSRQGDA
jgi:hypothetical protein